MILLTCTTVSSFNGTYGDRMKKVIAFLMVMLGFSMWAHAEMSQDGAQQSTNANQNDSNAQQPAPTNGSESAGSGSGDDAGTQYDADPEADQGNS